MTLAVLLAAAPFEESDAPGVHPEESALVARLCAGDERALEQLFRTRLAMLVRFAQRLGAMRAVAEDVVTDVFVAVWEGRERLNPAKSIDAYLFRAVRNSVLNARRGERREVARYTRETARGTLPGLGHSARAADTEAELMSAATIVWNAVAQLPERQRTVLYLRYTRGWSLAEIAGTMMVSVPAAKNLLQRAHQTLRTTLGGVFEYL